MSETLTLPLVHMSRARYSARAAIATPATLAGAAVAAITFAVYLATLAPGLYSLDSPELTAAAYRLGIAHPPGYPLYTLSGWLFSHAFPIGNVAYRLNVYSALLAALACTLTYAAGLRLTARPLVAAAAALALGFSYWFWSDALAAEVYSLDAALLAGLLLAAIAWRTRPTAVAAAAAGLLFGLGCATRTTFVLYLPALAAFAWLAGPRAPRSYAAALGGLAAGLSFYLYLPLRSAAGVDVGPGDYGLDGTLRVWDLASFSGFWHHVSAAPFRHDVFAYGPLDALREGATFTTWLAGSFLVVGLPLGIAGIVRQWRTDRPLLLLFAGMALPVTVFFVNYGALDKEFMFLPAYLIWSLWMVLGIDWAIDLATAAEPAWAASWLPAAAALALPALALAVNLPLVSLHGEHRVRGDAEAFLGSVAPHSVVYGRFLDMAPIQYLQEVEGQRPDVTLVNGWTVDDTFLLSLAAANVGVHPFYITSNEPVLRGRYQVVPAGKGFEVQPLRR